MERSTPEHAAREMTKHSLVPGAGYFRHDRPLSLGPLGVKCFPPALAANGSMHFLNPPNGNEPLAFRWIAAERAWARPGGFRLAFTDAHMGSHGWTYKGPAH